jgi:hypothetical protein
MYVDRGYFSADLEKKAQAAGITMHYTVLIGKKPDPEKISLTEFTIKEQKMVAACPEGYAPYSCQFSGKNNIIRAYFDKNNCLDCARQKAYLVEIRKNNAALRVEQKEVIAAEVRQRIEDKSARQEATSKRHSH